MERMNARLAKLQETSQPGDQRPEVEKDENEEEEEKKEKRRKNRKKKDRRRWRALKRRRRLEEEAEQRRELLALPSPESVATTRERKREQQKAKMRRFQKRRSANIYALKGLEVLGRAVFIDRDRNASKNILHVGLHAILTGERLFPFRRP